MLKPRVSLPTDAVLWEDGKRTKRCIATAAPNINKEIIKGISRFLIRDFFSDDVSLFLSRTSHTAVIGSLSCDLSPCSLLKSRNRKEGWSWVTSAAKRLRNGRDEDL